MNTQTISASELKRNAESVLNEVYFGKKVIAKIVPMREETKKMEDLPALLDTYFVYNLTIGKSKPDTTIMEQTENAVSFVENRPKISAQIQELLSGWLEAKYNGLINSNIEAIVAFGSILRGDAMYLSDLDLLLLSNMQVSNKDVAQFSDEITKQLEKIMPYARLDILRGRAFSIKNGESELKEFDSELKINYNGVIFAPPDQRESIETIIASVNSRNIPESLS